MTNRILLTFLNGYAPRWADRLRQRVAACFVEPVERMDAHVDLAACFASERGQYNATLLLASLLRHGSVTGSRIVGITSVDLFIPVLTFVFGQAQLSGTGAVVSTHRLRPEPYGLPPNESLLLDRTAKEVIHELGHTFGLVHCPDYLCVMHAATYVEDVDLKGGQFCVDCQSSIPQPRVR